MDSNFYKKCFYLLSLLGIVTNLNGCTSVSSQIIKDSEVTEDGIVYYMPRRDIRLEIEIATNTDELKNSPTITTTREKIIGKEESETGKTTFKREIVQKKLKL